MKTKEMAERIIALEKVVQDINGGVKVSHLAGQKCTAWPLYSRDRPGCQFQS